MESAVVIAPRLKRLIEITGTASAPLRNLHFKGLTFEHTEFNHIYDVMNPLGDGGGICTLGFQPGTVLRANHIHDVHRSRFAQAAPSNGRFIDEGSKGFLFESNVIYQTSAEPIRFNQCQRDWHTWRGNLVGEIAAWPQAGLESSLTWKRCWTRTI